MLTKLESKVELEETRWQAQLHQKENEITNLRIEIDDLRKKFNKIDKVFEKQFFLIIHLFKRLF